MAKAKAKAKATGACEPRSDWLKRSSTGARLGAAVESAASERLAAPLARRMIARARARGREMAAFQLASPPPSRMSRAFANRRTTRDERVRKQAEKKKKLRLLDRL